MRKFKKETEKKRVETFSFSQVCFFFGILKSRPNRKILVIVIYLLNCVRANEKVIAETEESQGSGDPIWCPCFLLCIYSHDSITVKRVSRESLDLFVL